MKRLQYFMECYFNQTFGFDELDPRIDDFKCEARSIQEEIIRELSQIIEKKDYASVSVFLKKDCDLELDNVAEVEKFINYLYDKILDRPTKVKPQDFET